jgi:hypothetical protein
VELTLGHLETAIRDHLALFLAGDVSLGAFTDWLVGATWNIDTIGDAAASQIAYSIEFALAEHSSGLLSEDELRAELHHLSQQESANLIPSGHQ